VAVSHDSARLALASYDKTVKLWDASSSECLQSLKGHSGSVWSVAFSHDSAQLASASRDMTIKLWDASSGKCLKMLEGHTRLVLSVAFSHDSARLASVSYDNTVKLWDLSSGRCLQTLDTDILRNISLDSTISFNSTGLCLYSPIGTLNISVSAGSNMLLTIPEPRFQGIGLESGWIMYNSEKLVWIPPEYQSRCLARSGKTISVGTGYGKVWTCRIELNES
jgi:WD40 repeat protein